MLIQFYAHVATFLPLRSTLEPKRRCSAKPPNHDAGVESCLGVYSKGESSMAPEATAAKSRKPTGVFTRSFLRDPDGTFSSIQFPGSNNTLAIKISPRGKVVGCFHNLSVDTPTTIHGCVWQCGNYE